MKRTALQFESRPRPTFLGRRSEAWQSVLGIVLLCSTMTYLVLVLGQTWKTYQATRELNQQVQQLLSAANTRLTSKPKSRMSSTSAAVGNLKRSLTNVSADGLSVDQRRQLDTVIHQLNTPWQDLFHQLERNTPSEVALINIEPDASRASVKLQAEAKSLDVLLSYADRMQSQDVFGTLTYSKHETNEQDPNKPLRLSFELGLRVPDRLLSSPSRGVRAALSADATTAPKGGKP